MTYIKNDEDDYNYCRGGGGGDIGERERHNIYTGERERGWGGGGEEGRIKDGDAR